MKKQEFMLLLSKEESYLVRPSSKKLHTRSGVVDLKKIKTNSIARTHLGKKFVVIKPTINDIIQKRIKRTAQVILPKDIALIIAYTGVAADSLVIDCGTGTGYLAIVLANFIPNGKIVTYEKDKKIAEIAKWNIKNSGLTNIKLKQKNIADLNEKNVDLAILDMQNPQKIIKRIYTVLKPGGWLVIYSPTIEEVISVNKEMKKYELCEIRTVENIVREWQTERTTRPKTIGLMHTGFLTFARKLGL